MTIAFRDRHIPIYSQIATLFRRRISDGFWAPGDKIPPIRELTAELRVSRATVRQAMSLLEQDGLIERHRGRGTHVRAAAEPRPMMTVETDWASFVRSVSADEPRLIDTRSGVGAPPFAAEAASVLPGYQLLRRVHLKQSTPFLYGEYYVAQGLYDRAPRQFQRGQIIPILDAMQDLKIDRISQILTIGTADLETAGHLEISVNAPVGRVRRIGIDDKAAVVYAAEVVYRGDMVQLDMTVER